MNILYRTIRDTTGVLVGAEDRLDRAIGSVAKYAAGEMARGAARALGEPTATSPPRKRHGLLARSVKPKVERIGPAHYRAFAGVPHGRRAYGPYVEYGTGPAGARDWPIYAHRYRWPRIRYSRFRKAPRSGRLLPWRGMHAHPFLTPQPFLVKPEVEKRLQAGLRAIWEGQEAA